MSNEDSVALFASKIKATPKAVAGQKIKNVNISKTNRNQVESSNQNLNNQIVGQLEKFEKNLEQQK